MMQIKLAILGVVTFAFLALGITAYKFKADAATARAEVVIAKASLKTAVEANAVNAATIAKMQKQDELNDAVTADLAQQLATSNAAMADLSASRSTLKDSDETVRDYLNAPVPLTLRGVYDR